MAGLPWIKVWTRVTGHPKVQRLERELGVRDALGIVIRLWCWAADYAPDGEVDEAEALTACRFARGDACRTRPEDVLSSFVSVGLLDPVPGGFRVHDWADMQTRHVEAEERKKAQAAERQAAWRKRHGVTTRNAGRNELRNALRNGDVTQASVTETETEIETETSVTETASHSEQHDHRLAGLCERLAREFGHKKPLGIGRDASRVVSSFARWLDTVGEDFTVSECARVARDKGVSPSHLSWWPGWLDTVTDDELHRWALQVNGEVRQ